MSKRLFKLYVHTVEFTLAEAVFSESTVTASGELDYKWKCARTGSDKRVYYSRFQSPTISRKMIRTAMHLPVQNPEARTMPPCLSRVWGYACHRRLSMQMRHDI